MKDTNLVKKLVQVRTIEATKKNINAKLVCIARNYGSPIIGHYYDAPLFQDEDWMDFNDPTKDWSVMDDMEDGTLPRLGFIYDSLKVGTNLEIVVMVRETKNPKTGKRELDKPSKVKCSFNGYTVYHEEEGKLICYAPFPEWENHIEKVYRQATGSDKKRVDVEKKEEVKFRKKATQQALSRLRMLWGI
jgi:hypothetical protein